MRQHTINFSSRAQREKLEFEQNNQIHKRKPS